MDSFERNKIFGAILGTGLLVLGLKNIGAEVFHTEAPEKPGYAIEVVDTQAASGDAGAPAAAVPIAALLAKADPVKGAAAAKACAACHDFSKGGPNKVGPHMWDIVERPMGSAEGFAYSEAFKAKGNAAWTYEELNKWLTAPKEYMPGTKMAFAGIKNDATRADVLAYLGSLADAPKPFPKP
jgi:cytochrome c